MSKALKSKGLNRPIEWSDEIVERAFAWMVFMGAAVLWRNNEHFRVQWLPNKLEGKASGKALGVSEKGNGGYGTGWFEG